LHRIKHKPAASSAAASATSASAFVVSADAVDAASDKDKSTKVKGHKHVPLFLCYSFFDDLYSHQNMTLREVQTQSRRGNEH
jgi:hypothetical protein